MNLQQFFQIFTYNHLKMKNISKNKKNNLFGNNQNKNDKKQFIINFILEILFIIVFFEFKTSIAKIVIDFASQKMISSYFLCLSELQLWIYVILKKLCLIILMLKNSGEIIKQIGKLLSSNSYKIYQLAFKGVFILFLLANQRLYQIDHSQIKYVKTCDNIVKVGKTPLWLGDQFKFMKTKVSHQLNSRLDQLLFSQNFGKNNIPIIKIQGQSGIGKSIAIKKYINNKLQNENNTALLLYINFNNHLPTSNIIQQFAKSIKQLDIFRELSRFQRIFSSKKKVAAKQLSEQLIAQEQIQSFFDCIQYLTKQKKIRIVLFIDQLNKWDSRQYQKIFNQFFERFHINKFFTTVLISNQQINSKKYQNYLETKIFLPENTQKQLNSLFKNIINQENEYYNNIFDAKKVQSLKLNFRVLFFHTKNLKQLSQILQLYKEHPFENFIEFINEYRLNYRSKVNSVINKNRLSAHVLCFSPHKMPLIYQQKFKQQQYLCTSKQGYSKWSNKMYELSAQQLCIHIHHLAIKLNEQNQMKQKFIDLGYILN